VEDRAHTVVDSPVGTLTLVSANGALTGLYMYRQRHRPLEQTFGAPDPTPFTAVIEQLDEYFTGQRTEFDVPVTLSGTPFQRVVWAALRDIPYGETVSYGQLAKRIGRTGAARAVGLANGKNPVGIIVPCHRVVGAAGGLTGYGGGLERKQHLLDFERHTAAHVGLDVPPPPRPAHRRPRRVTDAPRSEVAAGSAVVAGSVRPGLLDVLLVAPRRAGTRITDPDDLHRGDHSNDEGDHRESQRERTNPGKGSGGGDDRART